MLYEKLYPHMKRINEEHDGIMRGTCKESCCMCGRLTEFVEVNCDAYFCSEECLNKFENKAEDDTRAKEIAQKLYDEKSTWC